jgi:hypothetical protein
MPLKFLPLLLLVFFFSCKGGEEDKEITAAPVFFHLQVNGDEELGTVTCLLRFHEDDADGDAIALPGEVQLDGTVLPPDSARMSGVHYEARIPAAGFAGRHKLSFDVGNDKKVVEEFSFTPFRLKNDFTGEVSRRSVVLDFEGLEPGTTVFFVMTDTSFESPDINESLEYSGEPVVLDEEMMGRLVNGPVTMQLSSEKNRAVRKGAGRGRISIEYTLRRDFDLVE